MLTLTDHLPSTAQDDLTQIIAILFAETEDALVLATQKWKRQGRILKIILFGAHAEGVGFQPLPGGRLPKYSILVIVNDDRLVDQSNFGKHAEDRLMREHAIGVRLTAPVSLSVRGIQSVHMDLLAGRPFRCDAVQKGVMLYELPGHSLALPTPRDSAAIREERLGRFRYWFTNATEFLELARIAYARAWANRAMFQSHKATGADYCRAERYWCAGFGRHDQGVMLGYLSRITLVTPLVHPKPSWRGYSPPPPGRCSSTSYFSSILPVSR